VLVVNEFDNLKNEIERGARLISLSGLTSIAAKALVLSRLQAETNASFAIATESNGDLEAWQSDFGFFQSQIANRRSQIIALPSFETDPYSGVSPHAETQERRAFALWQLQHNKSDVVVLSARSLIQRTVTPDDIAALGCVLMRGKDFPPESMIERLIAGG